MLQIKKLILMSLLLTSFYLGFGQNKPFPQALNFPNCIKPSNVTQAAMNTSITSYYTYWKGKYLKNDLSSLPGGYYVKGEITGSAQGYTPLGSSEGQGYGMIIAALMAGYDANAKTIFDGLFKTARAYKSSGNSNLMGWVVADAASAQGKFGSATDGDMDIAYALLLAHYQWGSAGTINYLAEAQNMITNGLKASYVTNTNRLNMGDWESKSSLNSRPSDWMLSHLKAYKAATGDAAWDNVSNATYAMISAIQSNYSASTGLMPDFVTGNPVKPAGPDFLEGPNDGDYYYNACRSPLRFVMDFAHYGDSRAKTAVDKIVTWSKTKTNNNPVNFRAGYTLAGNDVSGNNYQSGVFIAPIVAASTCDAAHQAYLNSGWGSIVNMKAGYFEDTYNFLCMLYISGNWWIPQTVSNGQAPTVSITSPANNATFTAPATITISANAADADGTISKVEFYNGTTLLNSDNSSPYSYSWANVAAGTYSITAKATDNSGNTTTSSVVTVTVSVPQSPYGGTRASIPGTIQAENYDLGGQGVAFNDLTAENQGGSTYRTDAVDVEAMTGGGYNVGYIQAGEWMKYMVNVTTTGKYKLEAFVATNLAGKSFTLDLDGTTIATVNVPNTGDWQTWQAVTINDISLTAGDKVLRVYATTADFNLDKVVFSLMPNQLPTVSITTSGTTFIAPASVTINATAADPDGSISKVEFYNGATLLNSDNTSPYSYNWTNVAAGTYSITAKAYDNAGAVTTSNAISITVSPANQAPTVSITTNGTTFTAPASVTINATAADPDGSISKVEFYNGTTLLISDNTSPYSYNWTNVAAGTYSITAKAYDNTGAVTTSNTITITVNAPANQLPTVSITTNGTTFTAPASVTINATAADPDGSISKVEFYNGATLLNSDNTSPYSYNWTNVTAGTYSITAKAYDNAGAVTTSNVISITVNVPANELPTVNITTNGTTFTAPASVTINATAADPDGSISKVEFYNGATLLNSDNTSPYSYNWTNVAAGTYSITAKAYDNTGAVTTSNTITITVNAPANQLPTVSITTNGTAFIDPASVTINATAADPDGSISKVEFYNGTTLLTSDNTSPYSYNWTNVAAGTYSITAKAYDNVGAVATSNAISITVSPANQAPTVSITTNGTTFTAPASVTINATAADPDGSISKVEFYNGTTLLTSDNTSPYSYNWTNVAVGTYSIIAMAYDNVGTVTTSNVISITVNPAANQLPTVSITTNGTTFTGPASVTINATAADPDGSISKVEFYNGTTLLNSDNTSPYSYNWTNVAAGTYSITAKAYDNSGAIVTSNAITITVNAPANLLPIVSITTNGTTFTSPATIIINATAEDPDGSISKVEFYNGSALLSSDNTSPYSYTAINVAAGTYILTARAYDNTGASTESSTITVVVNNPNSTPVVTITSSVTSSVEEGTDVIIMANATDSDGGIGKIELFDGDTKIGEVTSEPFIFTLTGLSVGAHTITAVATDNSGGKTTSSPIGFTVSSVTSVKAAESMEIQLMNFPNPFNSTTEVQLTLTNPGRTIIMVYDNLGREVAVLENEFLTSGTYSYKLDTDNLISGTYVCKVISGNKYRSLMLVKQ